MKSFEKTVKQLGEILETSGQSSQSKWVIYCSSSNSSTNRSSNPSPKTMDGPFSKSDVEEKIRGGEISFSDLAWREGEPAWMRVGDIPEFGSPSLPSDAVTVTEAETQPQSKVDQLSAAELLRNVTSVNELQAEKQARLRPFVQPPDESDGRDLANAP